MTESSGSGVRVSEKAIIVREDSGVLTVILNRPERRNAMTPAMREELMAIVDHFAATESLRTCVVTGSGAAFCAGADITEGSKGFKAAPSTGVDYRDGGGQLSMRLMACPKPLIAAVNGPAVGMGAGMTLPMDIRVASPEAAFGFVYTRRAIAPESVSSWLLPRVVGFSYASRWLLLGGFVSAEEAHRSGLVADVVPRRDLLGAALEIAHTIADETSPAALAATKHLLWQSWGRSALEAHMEESRLGGHLAELPDASEGVSAFREGRRPVFTSTVQDYLPGNHPWLRPMPGGPR